MTTFVRSYYRLSNFIYAQASDNFSLPMIYSSETVALCAWLPICLSWCGYQFKKGGARSKLIVSFRHTKTTLALVSMCVYEPHFLPFEYIMKPQRFLSVDVGIILFFWQYIHHVKIFNSFSTCKIEGEGSINLIRIDFFHFIWLECLHRY